MKITEPMEVDALTDVRCDVCDLSTRPASGDFTYGVLQAHWHQGAMHEGERYEIHLCESCFLQSLTLSKIDAL